MPKFISKSRMDAQKYHEQAMETSNRMIRDAETGWSWLFGPSGQEMANVSRATEAEQNALRQKETMTSALGVLNNAGIQARSPTESASMQANAYQLASDPNMAPQDIAASIASRPGLQRAMPVEAAQAQFTPMQQQQMITNQQDKFLATMKGPSEVWQAYEQINGMLDTGDALGTRAAIIKLAKILDPTSVVREGEVTTIEGGTGLGNQIMNMWNNAINQGAPEEMADAIRNIAKEAAGPVLANAVRQRNEFRGALDTVFGADMPGAARIVTGSGLPWNEVEFMLQGGRTPGVKTDPDTGETYRVINFNSLPSQQKGP